MKFNILFFLILLYTFDYFDNSAIYKTITNNTSLIDVTINSRKFRDNSIINLNSNIFAFYKKNKFIVENIDCSKLNCNLPNGICTSKHTCQCRKDYAEIFEKDSEENNQIKSEHYHLIAYSYCNYHRKKQYLALFLEIFSFGIGHFYCNRLIHGAFKLVLELLMIITYHLMKINRLEIIFKRSLVNILFFIICFIFFCIHCLDLILYSLNFYNDGNGVPLLSWNTNDEIYIHKN